ncbi:MAG: hypothetical protein A6F70_02945 [Cycloclasticus sp. symbiont of Bathymodiolus heckerae]|nr:MAG: hypothetical protein A6F70_02945 [Cycloclasticus sp. symbiont of Bathymodiolus heckerae]
MLNHLTKALLVFIGSLVLVACHKAPALTNDLALKLLTSSPTLRGYTISIVTNNPNARGENKNGWGCDDKKELVKSGVVTCKESGRSSTYLNFTAQGKQLLVGEPWGDDVLRNARVIAVSQTIQEIQTLDIIDKSHAIIHYTWVYNKHTPFSNGQLKKVIALNVPQIGQVSVTLKDDRWVLDD